MWVERQPNEGETVKIEFAEWTNMQPQIGIFKHFHSGRAVIEFGDKDMWLDINSPFYVFEKD